MKKYLLIVTAFILSGCLPNSELTTASVTPPHSLSPVVSETVTLTVATSQATLSFPTLTPHPTLNPDEALTLQHYLKNNPPCQLPCWGGITPGKSTVTEAQAQLNILSSISDRAYFGPAYDSWVVGTLFVYYPQRNTVISIRPSYVALSGNDTVLNVGVGTQSLPQNPIGLVYGDQEYNSLLKEYMMPQIFSNYGVPNLIFARAELYVSEATAPDYFKIHLLYLNLGIFIRYSMPMETKENTFGFCPSESLIDLELTPQDIGDNYQEFFQQVGNEEWASLPYTTYDKSVEETLGITSEEFSRLVISVPETCFETPIDIWPEP